MLAIYCWVWVIIQYNNLPTLKFGYYMRNQGMLAGWLMPSQLSDTVQDHLPRADTAHSGLGCHTPINSQDNPLEICPQVSVIQVFPQQTFSSKMTLGCVKVTTKPNQVWLLYETLIGETIFPLQTVVYCSAGTPSGFEPVDAAMASVSLYYTSLSVSSLGLSITSGSYNQTFHFFFQQIPDL